ncbi:hypothetical protein CDD81_6296 [Ophiocordyceps australis]|uniref:Uncharacterized protein n=1 Tax=Ophiocordyceps australis TaxID=1399860 RepID=A0A2C5Y0X2_9HYPO|nr:hypothetical protein CDD81_6296 [Ophiocordyceps australis]
MQPLKNNKLNVQASPSHHGLLRVICPVARVICCLVDPPRRGRVWLVPFTLRIRRLHLRLTIVPHGSSEAAQLSRSHGRKRRLVLHSRGNSRPQQLLARSASGRCRSITSQHVEPDASDASQITRQPAHLATVVVVGVAQGSPSLTACTPHVHVSMGSKRQSAAVVGAMALP